jgi:hypothetical protein
MVMRSPFGSFLIKRHAAAAARNAAFWRHCKMARAAGTIAGVPYCITRLKRRQPCVPRSRSSAAGAALSPEK